MLHNGLPVTNPSQTILDFAATGSADLLRFVLANADYNEVLDVKRLLSMMGRGIAGSAALNDALAIHLPEMARARSRGERLLLSLFYADHQRDLELRAAGYVVLRYTERQLLETPAAVAADIRRFL